MPCRLLLNLVHVFCPRALTMFQEQSSISTLFSRRNMSDTTTSSRTQREAGSDPGSLAPKSHPTLRHYSHFSCWRNKILPSALKTQICCGTEHRKEQNPATPGKPKNQGMPRRQILTREKQLHSEKSKKGANP